MKPSEIMDGEGSNSEDEDIRKIVDRKVSMNEQNVIGKNFEKYNDCKPSQEIRRKIANYFLEYRDGVLNQPVTSEEEITPEAD
ncbi:MAG: hypothetical protein ACMG6E_04370 [Candidatus Roizmanbacteria bacterium]